MFRATLGFGLLLSWVAPARADLVGEVRARARHGDFGGARALTDSARKRGGVTPELLEALSWIARGELQQKKNDDALRDAEETYALCAKVAASAPLDGERHLPIAIGAAIEVKGQAMAALGERDHAVAFLRGELERYRGSSIVTRIQKNIHLLSLEGKPAPALEAEPHFGPMLPAFSSLKGKAVLLFFWAHWCEDCKAEGPIIEHLKADYREKGLVVIAPTQLYGAVAGGAPATPEVELPYIARVLHDRYPALGDVPVPSSSANFRGYGASTVPTLVLIDRAGNVALYHPGLMAEPELRPLVQSALRGPK